MSSEKLMMLAYHNWLTRLDDVETATFKSAFFAGAEAALAAHEAEQRIAVKGDQQAKDAALHIGSFFPEDALKKATMTPKQELAAAAGFCPKCGARHLQKVSAGGGIEFSQCKRCRQFVLLPDDAALSTTKQEEV